MLMSSAITFLSHPYCRSDTKKLGLGGATPWQDRLHHTRMFCLQSSVSTLLQVLRQARQHMALPANAVADVLAMAVQHKGARPSTGMSAVTSDLLAMWQHLLPADWAQRLTGKAASLLAVMLHQDGRCSEAAGIFESRMKAGQVCTLTKLYAFVLAISLGGNPSFLTRATKERLSVWYNHKGTSACMYKYI